VEEFRSVRESCGIDTLEDVHVLIERLESLGRDSLRRGSLMLDLGSCCSMFVIS
jgi:hypothetical protein